jgi:DNA-binding NarL/FixJ family response regulator
MPTRCKVVLYGDSVMLAGVGQSLERYPNLEVVSLDASGADAPRELAAIHPEAVILDLSIVTTDFIALLHAHADLLLVGLDPSGDRLLVLSGQQARSLTMGDLARLIETGMPLKPGT